MPLGCLHLLHLATDQQLWPVTNKRLRTRGGVWAGQLKLLGLCGHGNMGLTCREVNIQYPGCGSFSQMACLFLHWLFFFFFVKTVREPKCQTQLVMTVHNHHWTTKEPDTFHTGLVETNTPTLRRFGWFMEAKLSSQSQLNQLLWKSAPSQLMAQLILFSAFFWNHLSCGDLPLPAPCDRPPSQPLLLLLLLT